MKKYRKYIILTGILVIGALLISVYVGSIITKTEDAKRGLPAYLVAALPDEPYACAEITIKDITAELGGTVEISWKTFETAWELQEYIVSKEAGAAGEQAEWMYYQCKLPDDLHAIDLYRAVKRYDKAENPLCAVTCAKGKFYRFSQESEREIVVKDHSIYALSFQESSPDGTSSEFVQKLLNAFVNNTQEKAGDYLTGQILDEEKLYWMDHESRETTLENPKRTFTEIREMDACWGSKDMIMRNFGMLYDAEYEIELPKGGARLQVSFHFAKDIPATGYETFLMDGSYPDETYIMRVTDLDTGNLLQIEDVELCIERTVSVIFKDMNGDGFPDIVINRPMHSGSSESVMTDDDSISYILWSPEKNKFDFWGDPEEKSFYAPVRELAEDAERADYYVLADAQGELYIPKGSEDGRYVGWYERGMYVAQAKGVQYQYFNVHSITAFMARQGFIEVYVNPAVNKMGENALTRDWEHFVQEAARCSELCDGRVYNLNFEKYQIERGSDLYGYTFDFDADDKIYEIAVFIRMEKVNMMEIIGIRRKADSDALKDVTRYLGASVVDYGGDVYDGYGRMEDNVGAYDWDYPELHNMFTWAMDAYVIHARRPDEDFPNDRAVSFKEPRIENAIRSALEELWHLDDEERRAFEDRPLMMSDLAVITRLECTRTTEVPSVIRIKVNHCVQEIEVAKEKPVYYGDLAKLSGLQFLEISAFDLTDYSFIGELTSLRKLNIYAGYEVKRMDFLENLSALRSLTLLTKTSSSDFPGLIGFRNITDLSSLGNCKDLAYLSLDMPKLADFLFLENMPDIYTMVLKGDKGAVPDMELLPNARYVNCYGKFY